MSLPGIELDVKEPLVEIHKSDTSKPQDADLLISIIVVTWNAKSYALECLQSLQNKSGRPDVEVIVVDNGSSDGTPQAIRSRFPDVRLLENSSNLGFAAAN